MKPLCTYVDVRVNLDGGDGNAAVLKDDAEGGGDHALPDPGDDTSGHQDILHFHLWNAL